MENNKMYKFLNYVQYTVIVIAFSMLFGWFTSNVYQGTFLASEQMQYVRNCFINFISFPSKISQTVTYLKGTNYFEVVDTKDIEVINKLDKDLYITNAIYEDKQYTFFLKNLKTDEIIHKWHFNSENFKGDQINFNQFFPQSVTLLEDMSIVAMLAGSKNIFRLDKDSNIMWINQNHYFHHSIERGNDGIWTCISNLVKFKNNSENNWHLYRNDEIAKLDIDTGKIIFKKSLTELFEENNLEHYLYGFAFNDHGVTNQATPEDYHDGFHLNDVQPALKNSAYYNEGDVFISIRNNSRILHYRPKTNTLIQVIEGSFFQQHDVDIISDHEISIFNNNRPTIPSFSTTDNIVGDYEVITNTNAPKFKSSQVVVYNLATKQFTFPLKDQLEEQKIYTNLQGVHHTLSDKSIFIEPTYEGIFYLFKNQELIYRNYANPRNRKGNFEMPHWVKVYENLDFIK